MINNNLQLYDTCVDYKLIYYLIWGTTTYNHNEYQISFITELVGLCSFFNDTGIILILNRSKMETRVAHAHFKKIGEIYKPTYTTPIEYIYIHT